MTRPSSPRSYSCGLSFNDKQLIQELRQSYKFAVRDLNQQYERDTTPLGIKNRKYRQRLSELNAWGSDRAIAKKFNTTTEEVRKCT